MSRLAVDATAIRTLASGTGRRLVSLLGAAPEAFASRGDWLVLAAPETAEEIARRLPFVEVRVHDSPRSALARALHGGRRLRAALGDRDLVLQDPRPYADPARTLPCVHDLRQLEPSGEASLARRLWMRRRFPAVLRTCPLVTTVSEHVRGELVALSGRPAEEILVVPNGVVVEDFAGSDVAALGPLGLEPRGYLLAVGHREPRKNLGFLSELAALDRERGGRRLLVHAGAPRPGFDEPERLAAERGVADRVRWLGAVDEATLRALYRGAEAFLMPSHVEGFGVPLLEAMAAGVPVLAAARPPFDEIVAAGDLWPLDRPGAWLDRLDALAGDAGARESAVARGRERAAEFTWSRAAERQLRAIDRALEVLATRR
ncbi:MAG: glycosyltransferase family 1 protein [Planctomycetota bacterium]